MNGSIDRLGSAIIQAKTELSTKIDAVLLHQATNMGFSQGQAVTRRLLLDSRRFVITTIVALVVGLVGSVATIIWLMAG